MLFGSVLQAASLLLIPGLLFTATTAPAGAPTGNPDLAPILRLCLACHSGVGAQAELDLSERSRALEGGTSGPALVPGRASESLIYSKVANREMPPGAPLSEEQIASIADWINRGAAWSEWQAGETTRDSKPASASQGWAFRKLQRPPLPPVQNQAWLKSPVDAFVLHRLEAQKLAPSAAADRRTLIRRAAFDLLGLPPTPEEVDAFLEDTLPSAFERLVDRLLASPHYGERWGRHWLDLARFGESQGYERDKIRNHAWPYRDYVIESLNQDKPYDQFVKEQIAGDVLEPVTPAGIAATGFLVAAPWDEVGHNQQSVIMRTRVRAEEMEDIVGTVTQTFLGMTANCARCHDHKFDPIPQADYYRLKAALDGVWAGNRPFLTPGQIEARAKQVAPLQKRIGTLRSQIAALQEAARTQVLKNRHKASIGSAPKPISRWTFDGHLNDSHGSLHADQEAAEFGDGSLTVTEDQDPAQTAPLDLDLREKTLEAWVRLKDLKSSLKVMRVERLALPRVLDALSYDGDALIWESVSEYRNRTVELEVETESRGAGETIHLAVVYALDNKITLYRDGKLYGGPYLPDREGPEGRLQTFSAGKARLSFGGGEEGQISEARLYDRALSSKQVEESFRSGAPDVGQEELRAAMTEAQRHQLERLEAEVQESEVALQAIAPVPLVYAANSRPPKPTFVLERGDPMTPGEQVTAGGLSAVKTLPSGFGLTADAPEAERRLSLAEWIVSPENPLTARVLVNRVWHYHFGQGIVDTPNDFGLNGGRPSHPELIDWLASEFVADGWSLKRLHRKIMLSSTYQRSSGFNQKAWEEDPDNRLLWRYSPRRLEAEVIRDSLLAVSDQLNPERGGPGFRPFEVKIFNSHFYNLIDSADPEHRRRTIYRIVVRSAPDPMLESFDCPDASAQAPKRGITTTPLQSLSLMNNPFVLRQARLLAERIKGKNGRKEAQVVRAYRLTLGRIPTKTEMGGAVSHVRQHGLDSLCWILFNSSEFLYLS